MAIKTKPPLGLIPRQIVEELRLSEVIEAIYRYLEVGKKIPLEWIEEYNDLIFKKEI